MDELRRTHMPYCIQKLADGRYIVLNRKYKPLGIQSEEWVTYETHPSAVSINITSARAIKLDCEARENVECIYLYNDGCIPTHGAAHMKAYLNRLAMLMKIKIKSSA